SVVLLVSFSMPPVPPSSSLFPYTTLFRSGLHSGRDYPRADARWEGRANRRRGYYGVVGVDVGPGRPEQPPRSPRPRARGAPPDRSEEHTSELQSRENLVCRLLLEKKNMFC